MNNKYHLLLTFSVNYIFTIQFFFCEYCFSHKRLAYCKYYYRFQCNLRCKSSRTRIFDSRNKWDLYVIAILFAYFDIWHGICIEWKGLSLHICTYICTYASIKTYAQYYQQYCIIRMFYRSVYINIAYLTLINKRYK